MELVNYLLSGTAAGFIILVLKHIVFMVLAALWFLVILVVLTVLVALIALVVVVVLIVASSFGGYYDSI